jgi:hypothetical protein
MVRMDGLHLTADPRGGDPGPAAMTDAAARRPLCPAAVAGTGRRPAGAAPLSGSRPVGRPALQAGPAQAVRAG